MDRLSELLARFSPTARVVLDMGHQAGYDRGHTHPQTPTYRLV